VSADVTNGCAGALGGGDHVRMEVGLELPPFTVRVDRARLVAYAAASGDHNRIHWDERFARSVGLPGVIAHGMWTMGAAVEAVARWVGADRIVEYGTKFVAPLVVPEDADVVVEVRGRVAKADRAAGRAMVELDVTSGPTKLLGRARVTVTL